jgi:TonB-linked SusC/RagA family outer membrane protein
LTIGNTLNLTRSLNERVANDDSYSGILTNANGADPLMPVYDKNGDYAVFTDYHTNWLSDNPMKSAQEIEMNTTSNRVLGSIFAEYRFNNAFKFKSSWSLDYTDMEDTQFFDPSTTDAETTFGRAFNASYNNITYLGENYFTYKKTILEDHNFEVVAGTSVQKSSSKTGLLSGENFPVGTPLSNLINAAVITKAQTTATNWGLLSYIGRLNYDYKNRIILAASYRLDGSSRFSKENRFASFSSLSLGYRIVRTSDIDPNKNPFLSDLKFRASIGKTGDQELGSNYPNRAQWGAAPYLGQQGLSPVIIADPTLSWQENSIINAGVDFEFFKGRYGGSIEVFKSEKSKLLSNAIIAGTTGFQTVARNFGIIENKGLELQLFATPINTGKFRWTLQGNITFLKNSIQKTAQDGELLYAYADLSPMHILKEGQALGTFYGIKWLGVDPETGDMMYEDVNQDGAIDIDNDGQILGKALPTTFGGLNMIFSIKKFDLNIASQFSMGNKVFNYNRFYYNTLGWANEGWDEDGNLLQIFANSTVDAKKRWRNPGDITDVPRASLINRTVDVDNSSYFLEDGSFWRIRTINLGYTIRPANTKHFSSARFFTQVQNPFIFTKYSWFDPEVSSTGGGVGQEKTAGVDLATYPHARTYSVGVNVIF